MNAAYNAELVAELNEEHSIRKFAQRKVEFDIAERFLLRQ